MAEIEIIKGADNNNPPDTLRQAYPKINRNFTRINDQLVGHIDSNAAHAADDITYNGSAPWANVKQAIDGIDTRIDSIVAQAGDDNTEIVDARGGYPVLGDRLNAFDAQLADLAYNVKKYGAVGDGVTDDTVAIQAAIDAASAAGGGTVYVPPVASGLYYMVSALSVAANVKLQGTTGSKIKLIGGANSNVILINGDNVTVEGLEVDGNKSNQTAGLTINGIVVNGSYRDILIRQNVVRNVIQDGIYINGTNVKALENFVYDCDRIGISAGAGVYDVQISDNFVSGTGASAINVVGYGTNISITDNVVDGSGEDGVTGYNNANVNFLVANNVCRNCSNNGTHVAGTRLTVKGNIYDTISKHAIFIQGSGSEANSCAIIDGNQVYNAQGAHPIMVNNYTDVIITGNLVVNSAVVGSYIGCYVVSCTEGVISGNTFIKNGSDGLRLDNSTHFTIIGNFVRYNVNCGIRTVNTCTDITIIGNIVKDQTSVGIVTQNSSDRIVVVGNITKNNAGGNLSLVGTTNLKTNNLEYENSGKYTGSGTGSATTFSIAHGLLATPTVINVTPGSSAANILHYVTADATNITVTFATAPASGTGNVILYWEARV